MVGDIVGRVARRSGCGARLKSVRSSNARLDVDICRERERQPVDTGPIRDGVRARTGSGLLASAVCEAPTFLRAVRSRRYRTASRSGTVRSAGQRASRTESLAVGSTRDLIIEGTRAPASCGRGDDDST